MSKPVTRGTLTAVALALCAPAIAADPPGAVVPYYGDINPFYGDINPFYGDIDPFYGDIDPFYGNIDPFYGDINPFYGDINPFYGDINPFYGDINPFWGDIDPFWGDIDPFGDGDALSKRDRRFYQKLGTFWERTGSRWRDLQSLWDRAAAGDASAKTVDRFMKKLESFLDGGRRRFGKRLAEQGVDFDADFLAALLAAHGFDADDPGSFMSASVVRREAFMLAYYDGLMNYAGRDRYDHWMATANWRPLLSQVQGLGGDSVIGLLDAAVSSDAHIAKVINVGGYDGNMGGHGGSVASLMVAPHDNRGTMGIAPRATVVAYNPFDASGTADWSDIEAGIWALSNAGASIINMSLGKAGYVLAPEWNGIFSSRQGWASQQNTVFVKAAGNNGISQDADVYWSSWSDPALILVGSVDPSGTISDFSNRPGMACLVDSLGRCGEGDRLMDRFIVAPGEMILMDDGFGGTVRRSGTSFAAPLVSGTIALMHDRWPWLAEHPHESVEIIFRSARDLGAKGTDPVYGRGLLDIEASQSPLDWNALSVAEMKNGRLNFSPISVAAVDGTVPLWDADGTYISVYEHIGDTYRDFSVPLDATLVGKQKDRRGRSLQSFLFDDLLGWKARRDDDDDDDEDFTDVQSLAFGAGRLEIGVKSTSVERFAGNRVTVGAPHSEIAVAGAAAGLTLRFGHGIGAMALTPQRGFGLTRDYREGETGLNPVLGFASGGAFAAGLYEISPFFAIFGGVTETRVVHDRIDGLDGQQQAAYRNLAPYVATGVNFGLNLDLADTVAVNAAYSRLDERSAILGVQSRNAGDLRGGSYTDALTVGMDAGLGAGLTLAASATGSRTNGNSVDRTIGIAGGGILSTAFAVSLAKTGLADERDMLRFKLEQPLHIERGALTLTQVVVTDRKTGTLGSDTAQFGIAGDSRPLFAEILYAAPLARNGEFSLFGRAEHNRVGSSDTDALSFGGRVRIGF